MSIEVGFYCIVKSGGPNKPGTYVSVTGVLRTLRAGRRQDVGLCDDHSIGSAGHGTVVVVVDVLVSPLEVYLVMGVGGSVFFL